jgi:hypothetical protein
MNGDAEQLWSQTVEEICEGSSVVTVPEPQEQPGQRVSHCPYFPRRARDATKIWRKAAFPRD